MIGFRDKNGKGLKVGHIVLAHDKKDQAWIGKIVRVDPEKIIKSTIVDNGGIQCAFKSNYETWINNQEYASTLEIIQ